MAFDSPSDREEAVRDALTVLASSHISNRVFASVVNKASVSPRDPVEMAFEQICTRFDYFLQRLHREGDSQRGILIFDDCTYEETLQSLATDFRTVGHAWGTLRNIVEVPLFLNSQASRLIQLADLVAYSVFRFYEMGDDSLYSIIATRFDAAGGVVHGLHTAL